MYAWEVGIYKQRALAYNREFVGIKQLSMSIILLYSSYRCLRFKYKYETMTTVATRFLSAFFFLSRWWISVPLKKCQAHVEMRFQFWSISLYVMYAFNTDILQLITFSFFALLFCFHLSFWFNTLFSTRSKYFYLSVAISVSPSLVYLFNMRLSRVKCAIGNLLCVYIYNAHSQ